MALRWFQVIRHGEYSHFILADGYTVDSDWVTFEGVGRTVATVPANVVAVVIDVAAMLKDPAELTADAAKKRTYRKEST